MPKIDAEFIEDALSNISVRCGKCEITEISYYSEDGTLQVDVCDYCLKSKQEEGYDDGREDGLIDGRLEGFEDGKEEGYDEGYEKCEEDMDKGEERSMNVIVIKVVKKTVHTI